MPPKSAVVLSLRGAPQIPTCHGNPNNQKQLDVPPPHNHLLCKGPQAGTIWEQPFVSVAWESLATDSIEQALAPAKNGPPALHPAGAVPRLGGGIPTETAADELFTGSRGGKEGEILRWHGMTIVTTWTIRLSSCFIWATGGPRRMMNMVIGQSHDSSSSPL